MTYIFVVKFVILIHGDRMDFTVKLDAFDGPLDLMLHLVKENKLELMNLNMDVLATQYIEYIHQMQNLHLEIASEYLTELASLIEYKSRKLLPREKVEVEDAYEEDTRQKLVERLIEYQQFKDASIQLREQFVQRQKLYTRPVASMVDHWNGDIRGTLSNQSVYQLMKAMRRVISRKILLDPYETHVTIQEISVEQRMEQIKNRMETDRSYSFEDICFDCSNVHMIVVTFLAILDLIFQKWMDYRIDEQDRIWIWIGEKNE